MIKEREFIPLKIAVLTLSDTRSLEEDKSGQILQERLLKAGHVLAARELCLDDVVAIQTIVKSWIADSNIDVIVTTGGTGFTGRDITIEAVTPLFEKQMDGFSIIFHQISFAKLVLQLFNHVPPAALPMRPIYFCLPGSPGACKDAWDGIIEQQLDYRHKPCNFVEILPRLDEGMQRSK